MRWSLGSMDDTSCFTSLEAGGEVERWCLEVFRLLLDDAADDDPLGCFGRGVLAIESDWDE